MAIINGMYIHVKGESVSRGVSATSHPVEDGIPTTDTVRPQALAISLSGKIVNYGETKAEQVISKLKSLMDSGSLISYSGRNVSSNLQIRSFDSDHTAEINGGAEFTMELVKVRIAKSAYVPKKESVVEQETAAKKQLSMDDIKVGASVIFKGGSVYNSSDAKKASATRGRSTCKCTIINTRSWAKHPLHLISSDGGRVYGWVDFADIEGVEATSTSGKTNAGTQQTKKTTTSKKTTETKTDNTKQYPVYHKVKSGDTLSLLCKQYNYLTPTPTVGSVKSNNPHAFVSGATLKAGAYLLMGYK